jgi:HAD superfamily hydrolase (TIGR01509 family)
MAKGQSDLQEAPVRAVVLDFDGLIVDTETPIFEAWRAAYRRRGQDLGLGEWQHALGTHGGFDPLARLAELMGAPVEGEALIQEVQAENREVCDAQPLLPGVAELLHEARRIGLSTAVASSSTRGWVDGWLARHGIRDLFDVLCGREDVARVKPAPDLFLLAAERLGMAPAACLVFEDSPNGMRAARAAGMRCVAVPNTLTRELVLPDPDLVVSSLAERSLAEIVAAVVRAPAKPAAGATA